MKLSPSILLASALVLGYACPATARSHTEKVYAANGRRVAVIKDTNFGRKIYGEDGRRIATIKRR